ncbi:MAG: hypothetical protein P1V21_05035 [Rhizobiaceae bacterium]|nr:hypothetical protein [Rhizobiaceae bacterium]
MSNTSVSGDTGRRLSEVVREAKIAAAEREDVVVDMKEADRGRLELLAEELAPIFDEVPEDDEQFDFFLSSGLQPRLWIDAIAHVQMGPDRRTYRFVRDTRYGRVVMAESGSLITIADSVTHYVAERIVQRQKFLASDAPAGQSKTSAQQDRRDDLQRTHGEAKTPRPTDGQTSKDNTQAKAASPAASGHARDRSVARVITAILWFGLGVLVTVAIIAFIFLEDIATAFGWT